jgi:UDP-N-acetylglucosamine 2-epimerase (non-hydrolysing)
MAGRRQTVVDSSSDQVLHFFIGTKAQLIKMSPIMREAVGRGLPCRFVNAGQHAGSILPMVDELNLPKPDVTLHAGQENISTMRQGLAWLGRLVWQIIARPRLIREQIFGGHGGMCLIHGDTATTLVSLLMAKRAGLKVAHVEAGYRSFNIFDPFPEELIRIIAMRFADVLFVPTQTTFENLETMRVRADVIYLGANTIEDSVAYAQQINQAQNSTEAGQNYAVMSIHRFETVRSKSRLTQVVELAREIAAQIPVKFIMHGPTRHFLERYGLLPELEAIEQVEVFTLQPYLSFVVTLGDADFIVTDGGSIQEEAHILGIPCLVLRTRTEHEEGIGTNALLAGFDWERIRGFLQNYQTYRHAPILAAEGDGPSVRIVDAVLDWLGVEEPLLDGN